MRQFIVDDRIAGRVRKFYKIEDAKEDARKTMKIYMRLNSRVRCKQKDCNYYIYLEKGE